MIRVKTCFVAAGIVIDRDSNQVSAFGLLEDLQAESYPASIQNIAFFCIWQRAGSDPERVTSEFSITQNGGKIAREDMAIDFRGRVYNRCKIAVDRVTLKAPGTVVFRLAIPEHETAEWALEAVTIVAATPDPVDPSRSGHLYDSGASSISLGSATLPR